MKRNLYTNAIHGGSREDEHGDVVPPISLATSFSYDTAESIEKVFAGRDTGYVYSRIQNPSVEVLERRVTSLEEGTATVACASGMTAVSSAITTLAGAGDEIIASSSIFGGTAALLTDTLPRYGIDTTYIDISKPELIDDLINDKTKCIFVEVIGNPKLDVPSLRDISAIAAKHGVALIVDSTAATPFLIKPGEHGAAVTVHSASKYLNGHGTAIGGTITDTGRFNWNNPRYPHIETAAAKFGHFAFPATLRKQIHRNTGGCISPFNAFMISTGIETLALRMDRHCSNAMTLAERFNKNSNIETLRYPGLPSHEDHKTAAAQFNGRFGGLITMTLGSKERAFSFMNALTLTSIAANLGDVKTLAVHPASTFAMELTTEMRRSMGITDDLIRLSIGIEDVDDISEDIDNALNNIDKGS